MTVVFSHVSNQTLSIESSNIRDVNIKNSSKVLSILVPVYNVAEFLAKCIESILAQMDERAELILFNDASTDNSGEILDRYADNSLVTVVHGESNRGVAVVRNELITLSKGKYLWFIDSDDYLLDNVYNAVMIILETLNLDMIVGDYVVETADSKYKYEKVLNLKKNKIFENRHNFLLQQIIKSNKNYIWNCIFNRAVVSEVRFPNKRRFEDIFFMTDIAIRVKKYIYLAEPFIFYRYRPNSSVNSKKCESYISDYLDAFIYRVETCMKNSSFRKKDIGYLCYKVFNRFTGLVLELSENDIQFHKNLGLLNYIYTKYYAKFYDYYLLSSNVVGVFRQRTLAKNLKIVNRIFLENR